LEKRTQKEGGQKKPNREREGNAEGRSKRTTKTTKKDLEKRRRREDDDPKTANKPQRKEAIGKKRRKGLRMMMTPLVDG
jgi:hypothetical protein